MPEHQQLKPINVSVYDAAYLMGISHFTVRAWCRSGKMAYRKLGTRLMIPQTEIERILSESLRDRKTEAVA
jgi:excisionase family DNA binding protein